MSISVVKYSLGEIRPFHREIARRLVVGERPKAIKEALGISDSRFSIITSSPLFKVEVKKLEVQRDAGVIDITKTLKELSPIALEQIERTMYKTKSDSIRLQAAESILDRAGYSKITKSDVNVSGTINHSSLTKDEIRQLIKDRLERMRNDDEVVASQISDAESIEVDFTEPQENVEVEILPSQWCPPDGHKGDGNGSGS